MRAAALESGRGAPVRHVTAGRRPRGDGENEREKSQEAPTGGSPAPSRIDMLPSAERKKQRRGRSFSSAAIRVSLQPFAAPS